MIIKTQWKLTEFFISEVSQALEASRDEIADTGNITESYIHIRRDGYPTDEHSTKITLDFERNEWSIECTNWRKDTDLTVRAPSLNRAITMLKKDLGLK